MVPKMKIINSSLERLVQYYIRRCPTVKRRVYGDSFIFSQISPNRKHVWIVAAPKSGSTWLSWLLREALPFTYCPLCPAWAQREQEIDVRMLASSSGTEDVISQNQHCRYSPYTLDILRKANIKCVLSSRNIFDTVLSMHDHQVSQSHAMPSIYSDSVTWNSLSSEEDKLGFIVDLCIPWYFNFYAGWLSHVNDVKDRMIISRYEDLRENPLEQLLRILNFWKIPVESGSLEKAISSVAKKNTRMNKGITERGKRLPLHLVERIVRMANYYPHLDFSFIGITENIRRNPAAYFEAK